MPIKDAEARREYNRQRMKEKRERERAVLEKAEVEIEDTENTENTEAPQELIAGIPEQEIPQFGQSPDKKQEYTEEKEKLTLQSPPIKKTPQVEPAQVAPHVTRYYNVKTFQERYDAMENTLWGQGWAFWNFDLWGIEAIIVLDDHVSGYPGGFPVISKKELDALADSDAYTLRMVLEAKRIDNSCKYLGKELIKHG